MSQSLLFWLPRALGVVQCLFFAVAFLALAVNKLASPPCWGALLEREFWGDRVYGAAGFLLPGLSLRIAFSPRSSLPFP